MLANTAVQELVQKGFSKKAASTIVTESMRDARKIRQLEDKQRAVANMKYNDFLCEVTPGFDWQRPHAIYLSEVIDRVVSGEFTYVGISISPRVGKSETVTKRLPVYLLERDPKSKIIVGAYNQTLAEEFTGAALDMYRERNPGTLKTENVGDWKTVDGGSVYATGVGSGVTGRGATTILVDDPIKNIIEAYSITYRNRVWNWFNTDLMTRRNKLGKTPVIVIQTRWHSDDLLGRLEKNEEPGKWFFVKIPAIAKENDILGRLPGESIWEERMPIKELLSDKKRMGLMFNALYDQEPVNEANGTFRVEMLKIVQASPVEADRVRYWDKAATEGRGDFTVGLLMAMDANGLFYVEDVIRGQWDKDTVRRKMRQTLELDTKRYRNIPGHTFKTVFEREPGGDGKSVAIDIIRAMAPYEIEDERPSDNKTARAGGFAVQVNAGNVNLVEAEWNQDLIMELAAFVAGINNRHDDIVDGCSGSFNRLAIDNLVFSVR